ncbi:MAG: hypothetical protein M3340_00750 [Actinomycetota bacterium]|nr:hypothetical protein [Actinomycetota bacterium]
MDQNVPATPLKALRALRSAVAPIALLAGVVIVVADVSAAIGWALVVLGAALIAARASDRQGPGFSDGGALPL